MSILQDLVQNLVRFSIAHYEKILGETIPPDHYENLPPQDLYAFLNVLIQSIVEVTRADHEIIHLLRYVASVIRTVQPLVAKTQKLNAVEQETVITALEALLTNCYLLACMDKDRELTISYRKGNSPVTFKASGLQRKSLDEIPVHTGSLIEELFLKPFQFDSPEDILAKLKIYMLQHIGCHQNAEPKTDSKYLRQRIKELEAENTALRAENASLRAKKTKLEHKLADNSSSIDKELTQDLLGLHVDDHLLYDEAPERKDNYAKRPSYSSPICRTSHKKVKSKTDVLPQLPLNRSSSNLQASFFAKPTPRSFSTCPSFQDPTEFPPLRVTFENAPAEEYPPLSTQESTSDNQEPFSLVRTNSFLCLNNFPPLGSASLFEVGTVGKPKEEKGSLVRNRFSHRPIAAPTTTSEAATQQDNEVDPSFGF